MKVTTSRDPSQGARRLGKVLAGFLGVPYITRGKRTLDDEEGPWLVIAERNGSPRSILKRSSKGEDLLEFTLEGAPVTDRLKKAVPVVIGDREMADRIAEFFELDTSSSPAGPRVIEVRQDHIDLMDDGAVILRLKV